MSNLQKPGSNTADTAPGTSASPGNGTLDYADPRVTALIDSYWRKNVTVMAILLAIWAFVGLGCGILWADWLNQFALGGFPLGFWFAQQGAIATFIVLILVYCLAMNRFDRRHHEELDKLRQSQADETNT